MPDEVQLPEELIIRKRRAAAEHTAVVAADANECVARLEKKVERARADLSGAQDALAAARTDAKAREREAIEAKAAADAVTSTNGTDAHAQTASGGGKVG